MVRHLDPEAVLALQDRRPPAGVDDPGGADLSALLGRADGDDVGPVDPLDAGHREPGADLHPKPLGLGREGVLEPAPIELVGRGIVDPTRQPHLDPPSQVLAAGSGEEEAQAHLAQLLALQVRPHPADLAEVVGADLQRRLAHLVGRLGHRPGALLDDRDRGLGPPALELDRQRQPGQATAENRDVEPPGR